jgi:conjugative transfer region protein TrbK
MNTVARVGAIAFVAIAITMTAIETRDGPKKVSERATVAPIAREADPLRGELIRCQAIGQAGASDPDCLRAWAENRRRFLAPGARPQERLPDQGDAAAELMSSASGEPADITKSTASAKKEER